MKKVISFLAIFSLYFSNIYAQKTFHIKLQFDNSIDIHKLQIRYYDGKNDIFLPDTLSQRILDLTGRFYSQFLPIYVSYNGSNAQNGAFFINNKPAKISFYLSIDKKLKYKDATNAKLIFDTTNSVYEELLNCRRKTGMALKQFMKKNGNKVFSNDSLTHLYHKYVKELNNVSLPVLKKHASNYFSFWYFRDDIVELSMVFFPKDTTYIKSLINYFKSVFPDKYTASIEGKTLIKRLKSLIVPLKANKTAPVFSIKSISGKYINLKNYRGKYILLDFWATWCAPCMKEIPLIKNIRKEYSPAKLAIIGISWDRNLTRLEEVITQEGMNWTQIYDRDAEIINLYGVHSIPQLFLINKEGIVVYESRESDRHELLNILKKL